MNNDITQLLGSYPRCREPLPSAYQRIYEQEYQINRSGNNLVSSLVLKVESWMHRQVARDKHTVGSILEIGAGTLNHIPYEKTHEYDVVEPYSPFYEDSPLRTQIRQIFTDLKDIPAGNQYSKVISIAVLEHIEHLPELIARAALLVKDGGEFQHAIPSEGAFLWGLGWRLTSALSFRLRHHLPYKPLVRYQHINTAPEILRVIRYFFKETTIYRFPFPFHHLSLYTYISSKNPQRKLCEQYLLGIGKSAQRDN